ncbi:MAG: type II secretion system minor pseudopilin GspK [Sulfurifustis sp.]
MRPRERGVALITAMLIVAIIATLATTLALGQQVWLRQAQNLSDLAEAERLRQSAFEGAAAILTADGKNAQTSAIDYYGEAWAQPITFPIDNAVVNLLVKDAQGRFNLNNLILAPPTQQPGQPGNPGNTPTNYRDVYMRLLTLVGVDPGRAAALAAALIDWLDDNSDVQPGGAEDLDYLNHDPPYRAANRALMSVDELRLVSGYTPDIIEKLRDHVIALPAGNQTPINVNTASAEVLAALTGADLATEKGVVDMRDREPFKNKETFQALHPSFKGACPCAVVSNYFIVSVTTQVGRILRTSEGLIERPSGGRAQALWYRQVPPKMVLDEEKSS